MREFKKGNLVELIDTPGVVYEVVDDELNKCVPIRKVLRPMAKFEPVNRVASRYLKLV